MQAGIAAANGHVDHGHDEGADDQAHAVGDRQVHAGEDGLAHRLRREGRQAHEAGIEREVDEEQHQASAGIGGADFRMVVGGHGGLSSQRVRWGAGSGLMVIDEE